MRLCITGGGTGGHLMIAEALVQAAAMRKHEVIFIGSTSGQDQKYFKENSKFSHVYFLPTSGVVNKKGFGKIGALWGIFKAFFTARTLLRKHKIQALYSVGGFSAAPASFAAISLGLPLFIHEQNAITGRLNALLKPFAKRFISAYDADSPIRGYPVKQLFSGHSRIRKNIKTVIFLGGSQGAKAINDLALRTAPELQKKGITIIHQCGENDFERVKEAYASLGVEAELYGFTKELYRLITRADLAVSRAGASTLWELCANGLPALYVPYPYAAGDHQYHNAKFIVENNLGWCHRESENLYSILLALLGESLELKSKGLLALNTHNVADLMIQDLERIVQ